MLPAIQWALKPEHLPLVGIDLSQAFAAPCPSWVALTLLWGARNAAGLHVRGVTAHIRACHDAQVCALHTESTHPACALHLAPATAAVQCQ